MAQRVTLKHSFYIIGQVNTLICRSPSVPKSQFCSRSAEEADAKMNEQMNHLKHVQAEGVHSVT